MYYLLEDNRIIDRLSIREDLDLPFEVDFYVGKDEIVLTIDHNYFEHISIIKKAENLLDLIEKGDLIKSYRYESRDENDGYDINNVDRVEKGRAGILIAGFNVFVSNDDILAIYKPDANGNYIKVWEKKEDE